MKLASFDIFDTVLLRTCGKPDNVFYLLAKVLYPTDHCMQKAFLMWRQQAENLARVRHQNKEVNIQAIYDDVVDYGDHRDKGEAGPTLIKIGDRINEINKTGKLGYYYQTNTGPRKERDYI